MIDKDKAKEILNIVEDCDRIAKEYAGSMSGGLYLGERNRQYEINFGKDWLAVIDYAEKVDTVEDMGEYITNQDKEIEKLESKIRELKKITKITPTEYKSLKGFQKRNKELRRELSSERMFRKRADKEVIKQNKTIHKILDIIEKEGN